MSQIYLNNVESLSYLKTFNYWGDIFNYSSTDSYTLKSRVSNNLSGFTNESILPVWSGFSGIIKTGLGYYGFLIDGVNLGSGKITSFNWNEGTDVQSKTFSLSFEIASSGNLYNVSGTNYLDINTSVLSGDFKYVNGFEETISVSLNNNKIQETSQNVSFEIDDPLSDSEKINLKNKIFSGFARFRIPNIGLRTLYPDIILGNSSSGYINYFNETSDTLNSRFSFEKKSFYDNDNKATWNYSHAIQLNGNDTTVVENGSIKSIYFEGSSGYRNLSGARNRWSEIKTGIYNRVLETFQSVSGWSGLYPSGCDYNLINVPVDRRWQEDPFAGTIDYTYAFSNNSAYTVSGYIFSNSRSSSIDQAGYYIITENGEYKGISQNNSGRFQNAYNGFLARSGSIIDRISGTFLLASYLNKFLCVPSGDFYLTNKLTSYKEFDGIVSYSNTYIDNPSYYPSDSDFIKYENTITDKPPVHLHNKFLVPRQDEYIQDSDQSTEGSFTNNIKIVGKRGVSIEDYLTESYTKVVMPTGSGMLDSFLKNMSYSFSPFENTFEATFEYYYSKYKESEDILV